MPMYRVLKPLSRKHEQEIPVGTLTDLAWLDEQQQATMEMVGAVSRIAAPPLAQLPGWKLRAGRLGKLGIHTFDDFLERDPAELADAIGANPRTVHNWRAELVQWLTVPPHAIPNQGRRGR